MKSFGVSCRPLVSEEEDLIITKLAEARLQKQGVVIIVFQQGIIAQLCPRLKFGQIEVVDAICAGF